MLLLGVDIHGMDNESKSRDVNSRIRSGSDSTGIWERGTGNGEYAIGWFTQIRNLDFEG
jgi:hypothetical protein